MISALKMTAERIAERGVLRSMMLIRSSCGNTARNIAGTIAKYFATSFAIENVVSEPRVMSSCLPISTMSMSFVGSESRSTMFPASFAAWVPVFIATPTSACASAGASFVPSPVIATSRLPGLLRLDVGHLLLGGGLGDEVVDAGLLRDDPRGDRVVAGHHHGADAHLAELLEALLHPGLDRVLQVDHAERLAPSAPFFAATTSGVPPRPAMSSTMSMSSTGTVPPFSSTQRRTESAAPLRMLRPSKSTPLIRVCAVNGDELARPRARGARARSAPAASTRIDRPSGVSSARLESSAASASSRSSSFGRGTELGRLAGAVRDGAGLVEQQRVHVTRRFDRPAAHRQHVAADEAVHARDADRREQAADRGRDQAHQQRDQHDRPTARRSRRSRTAAGSPSRAGR